MCALAAALVVLVSPAAVIAQDDSGPFPVEPAAAAAPAVEVVAAVPGLHEVKVIVDPAGVVPETNEGNNGRVETWEWIGEETHLLFLPVILH